ncbi:Wzz/FepE/Etk N-terminal domain-containing protein [Domibacillus sp. A3M-37]|uniref:YveK family protein n=1 Tax=Domibacillus sp. A3M-37 TaxID=2962037 RepID=UPI0020B82703|nr:Wzz/FepE/Etk N-terminal domain-containing protein [Domibacillus sp. A3M-37]MCP3761386.1 Wzz/FepE/Etk N-terminal domain-containing protein [Domibacillus sp. A3M-37]
MEEAISLKDLMGTLRKRLKLIVLVTMAGALISGMISFFLLTPVYQASTQLLVNQAKTEQQLYDSAEMQVDLQMINTYNVIIKSPAILEKVAQNLDLDLTPEQLSSKITVANEQDSQVVNVMVQDGNQETAAHIANETASVFQKEILTIMNVDNVSILATAEVQPAEAPIKPQPLLNIVIGLVFGLMAGIGLAFLLEYLDNTIKSEQDIERLLELPVLGSVAVIHDKAAVKKKETALKKQAVGSGTIGS